MLSKKPAETYEPDYKKDRDFFESFSFYLGTFFDSANGLFYRIAQLSEKNELNEREVKSVLVVCDDELNYIGEWQVPSYYRLDLSFTSSKGLMLFNQSRYVSEIDFLLPYDVFDVLSFSEM